MVGEGTILDNTSLEPDTSPHPTSSNNLITRLRQPTLHNHPHGPAHENLPLATLLHLLPAQYRGLTRIYFYYYYTQLSAIWDTIILLVFPYFLLQDYRQESYNTVLKICHSSIGLYFHLKDITLA